ncbi:AtaL-like protein [Pseudonocardia sp.]|uniref:AtaL-like protein n=1 Tax=Pseudonocardia sp. TaxID=60912 RepID=UPI003D12F50D
MIELSRTVLVNDDPAEPQLDRSQVWQGLLLKANDALPFVPQMDSCHVLERGDGWLVRDILLKGTPARERVTFEPERRVRFERIRGAERGTIENVIDADEQGRLTLRFSFALTHEDLVDGSDEEREHFAPMVPAYENAVAATLAAVRRTAREQGDALAAGAAAPGRADVPAWIVAYYEAADGLDMDGLMALHTEDSTATVANHPTLRGKDAIREGIGQLWSLLRAMRHTFVRTWEVDGGPVGTVGIVDARVTYVLQNGRAVTVPVMTILTRRGELVSDLRFCIDMAPVFAALAPVPADAAGAQA